MNEKQAAIRLANIVLNNPRLDPDSDLSMLARQFLRSLECEQDSKRFRQLMDYHGWHYHMTQEQPMECGVAMEFQQRTPEEVSVSIESLLDKEIIEREKQESEEE